MILLLTKDKGRRQTRGIFGASEREENVEVRMGSVKVPALITKLLVNYKQKQKQRSNLCLLRDQWVLSTTSKYDFVMIKKSWGNHDIRMIFRVWTDVWYALYHRKT